MKGSQRKMRSPSHHPVIRARKHKKIHEEAVEKIIENLSWLKINGFLPAKIILRPIKFPHIRHDRTKTETGDMIFIWERTKGEWEIVNIEITTAYLTSPGKYFKRMEKTFNYLYRHWKKWLDRLGLDYREVSHLWFRPVVIFYPPHLFGFEAPSIITGKTQKIF